MRLRSRSVGKCVVGCAGERPVRRLSWSNPSRLSRLRWRRCRHFSRAHSFGYPGSREGRASERRGPASLAASGQHYPRCAIPCRLRPRPRWRNPRSNSASGLAVPVRLSAGFVGLHASHVLGLRRRARARRAAGELGQNYSGGNSVYRIETTELSARQALTPRWTRMDPLSRTVFISTLQLPF